MASDIAGSTGSNEIFRHWFLSPLSSVFVSSTPFTDCLPPLLVAICPSFHPRSFLPSSKCGSLLPRIPSNLIASHWLCHMSVSEPISVALGCGVLTAWKSHAHILLSQGKEWGVGIGALEHGLGVEPQIEVENVHQQRAD